MKHSKLDHGILVLVIFVSLFLQSYGNACSSNSGQGNTVDKRDEESSDEEFEIVDGGCEVEFLEKNETEELLSEMLLVKEGEITKLEEEETRCYPKRDRTQTQMYIHTRKMETPLKRQDFSKADEELKLADPSNHIGGSGLIGGYKWDTVIKFQEVNIEDYFKRELHKRLLQSSIVFRAEKKKTSKSEAIEKHKKRAVQGSPSPNGKNMNPVNVRLKIVNDPTRIVSLHQANDIAAIFHKKDTKEQGTTSYAELAHFFAKIIKEPGDSEKLSNVVWLAVVDKKDIQKEYEELPDAWKDYLLDFIGVQVAEFARASFHAKDEKHREFNFDAVQNALKHLKTYSFKHIYVDKKSKFAPFAGEGGASFFREGFLKSTTPQYRSKARRLSFGSPSKVVQGPLPESEEQ